MHLKWFPSMSWDKARQLRNAAQYCFRFRRKGQRHDILRLERELNPLRDIGMESLSSEGIIHGWMEAGWVKISPNGNELRLTEAGNEQLAQWEEEDSLWAQGATEEIKLAKRLKAGEPATNLRKIAQVIRNGTLICVHDPYITVDALLTLLKLGGLGVDICKDLHLLMAPLKAGKAVASIASYLRDLNTEMCSQWKLRSYTGTTKPHRRFLILQDKSVITCGLSLNNINKDEALDRISMGDNLADYDRNFFDKCWVSATPV
jgi:hypothetical protein